MNGNNGATAFQPWKPLTGAGRVVGFVKPHPIALPAFEKCRAAMDEAFEAAVRDGVEENAAG